MESFRIVHIFNKLSNVVLGFFEGLILLEIHLLLFSGLEKALGLGIVVRIPDCRQTDASLYTRASARHPQYWRIALRDPNGG